METKKSIAVTIIIIILMVTIGTFVVIMAKRGVINAKPALVGQKKTVNQSPDKNSSNQTKAPKTGTDSDVAAMESDLNSINDEDFGESGLSDQELGL